MMSLTRLAVALAPLLVLLKVPVAASEVSTATSSVLPSGSEANSSETVVAWPSAFTAPGVFPTTLYSSYYNDPTQTSAQVQPVISDPVLVSSIS